MTDNVWPTEGKRFIVGQSTYDATRPWYVEDRWVTFNRIKGRYATRSQAQARARVLNSRNGGK